jgi:hypothetical protein
MLISKSYAVGDIVSFKIVNGDEIIGRIANDNFANGYEVERPCTVMPSAKGIGLIQSLFTGTDSKVTLQQQHVIMHSPTIKEMQDHYIQTTTGITLAR